MPFIGGVVEIEEDENGDPDYYVTMDLPEDFALISLFLRFIGSA